MRRGITMVLSGMAVAVASVGSGQSAAGATTASTTFAVVAGVTHSSSGYNDHISGVGLSGRWRGWHLAADISVSTDCYNDCAVDRFAWELYDGNGRAAWGTCALNATTICDQAGMVPQTGEVTIPVIVTGGSESNTGSGTVTGNLTPTVLEGAPGSGDLTVTLSTS